MDADLLLNNFETIAEAPGGVARLRELILRLAVEGKLVPQDPSDEPAESLLIHIRRQRIERERVGLQRKPRTFPAVPSDEQPFSVPNSWCWARLSDVVLKITDGTHHSPPNGENGEFKYVTAKNIKGDGITLSGITYVDRATHKEIYGRCDPDLGDILLVKDGATTGVVTVNNLSEPFSMLSSVALLKTPNGMNPWFLVYAMRSPLFYESIRAQMKGAAITRVTLRQLNHVALPIPPSAEQRRIVARVDELMALCDELEAKQQRRHRVRRSLQTSALDALTTAATPEALATAWSRVRDQWPVLTSHPDGIPPLRQAILDLAVQGKLVRQDASDESAAALLVLIERERAERVSTHEIRDRKPIPEVGNNEIPCRIPAGWVWGRFGDVTLDIESGWSPKCEPRPKKDGEWGVLKVSAVSWGDFKPEEHKALPTRFDPRPQHEVRRGDFLMSRANTAELVGRSVVVETTPPRLLMSDKILRVLIPEVVNRRYLDLYNSSTFARSYFADRSSGTSSSMRNVSREIINLMPVPLPPLAEQQRIVARVEELMKLCEELEDTATRQSELSMCLALTTVASA